ncbi:uncharacterized protein KD926_002093 [Aspergillus affinis]|uniref:uncharacterized protein n=1 Tax=Aspergillus affinis TaxID=1070780 RepID=UPI0022FDC418|nr:uncharacterized protein KD926_002093 [Aspergillus affinis]KAI9036275.1 hypothetical protein KD926_002093 [Aspergillus affinis]
MDACLPLKPSDSLVAEITQLYVIEEWSLKRMRSSRSTPRKTVDQWKAFLKRHGITKNLCWEEVSKIKGEKGSAVNNWTSLVLADGLLLDNMDIAQHYKRGQRYRRTPQKREARNITYVDLPFRLTILQDPEVFKSFRRFLFYTRLHFETSFERGIWAPNPQGLYARSMDLRLRLSELSEVHNKIVDALEQFRAGRSERGWAIVRDSFKVHGNLVGSNHHRQFPDLLAILLLLQRGGHGPISRHMVENLLAWSQSILKPNDPRRILFQCLPRLSLDPHGHLYQSFDSYCRRLWQVNARCDEIRAYVSYNQASFPRADIGEFYNLFEGKPIEQIYETLHTADIELGDASHETFTLWHTAVRSLGRDGRYGDMTNVVRSLCTRIYPLAATFGHHEHRQLNLDSALSFFLLGGAEEILGDLHDARLSFQEAIKIRSWNIPFEKNDHAKAAALRRLLSIALKLGDLSAAKDCNRWLDRMYSEVELRDKEEREKASRISL